jgi:hypothetical protein
MEKIPEDTEQAIVDMALAISESIMTDHMCDAHKDSGACDRRLHMLDNYDKARARLLEVLSDGKV